LDIDTTLAMRKSFWICTPRAPHIATTQMVDKAIARTIL